LEVYQN